MLEQEGVENLLSGEPKTIEHGIESYNSLTEYKEGIIKNGIYAIGVKLLQG
jgi:ASC-1-like (ASCH) protein